MQKYWKWRHQCMKIKTPPVFQIYMNELHTFFRLNRLRFTPSQTTVVFTTTDSMVGNNTAFSYSCKILINDNYNDQRFLKLKTPTSGQRIGSDIEVINFVLLYFIYSRLSTLYRLHSCCVTGCWEGRTLVLIQRGHVSYCFSFSN